MIYNYLYVLSSDGDKWTGYTGTVTDDPSELLLLFSMDEQACKPPQALLNGCLTFLPCFFFFNTLLKRKTKEEAQVHLCSWKQNTEINIVFISSGFLCISSSLFKETGCLCPMLVTVFFTFIVILCLTQKQFQLLTKWKFCIVRLWTVIFIYWNIRHLQTVFIFSETFWNKLKEFGCLHVECRPSAEESRVKMFWLVPAFWAFLSSVVKTHERITVVWFKHEPTTSAFKVQQLVLWQFSL